MAALLTTITTIAKAVASCCQHIRLFMFAVFIDAGSPSRIFHLFYLKKPSIDPEKSSGLC